MRRALLVADLPGVAGVDFLEALAPGSVPHYLACQLLTQEVNAAVAGFLEAGFDHVRVVDAFALGVERPNLRAGELAEEVELLRAPPLEPEIFSGVEAAAFLGAHVGGGLRGFAPHTFFAHAAWRQGRRRLSEVELFVSRAAELGVPLVFIAGDQALGPRLAGLRFIATKRSLSVSQARSRPAHEVREQLRGAAKAKARSARPMRAAAIDLCFKSRWQAEAAERAGARRTTERSVRVESVGHALQTLESTEKTLRRSLRTEAELAFTQDVKALLLRPFEPRPPRSYEARARRALEAFLDRTNGKEDWRRADRALTLHMLEGHAPEFFERRKLEPVLQRAVKELAHLEQNYPPELSPDAAMARLDALYVRSERGLEAQLPLELGGHLEWLRARGEVLHAWLLEELAIQLGAPRKAPPPGRPLRSINREGDLYWLTHLFLLESRYLRKRLAAGLLACETEELLLAAGWVIENELVELASELAFCLQLANERTCPEHGALLELLARWQQPDGSVRQELETERSRAHTTAGALLAFAGATLNSAS